MARMTLYHINGDQKDFDTGNSRQPDLTTIKSGPLGLNHSYNDRVDSIFVYSGIWRLFPDAEFLGEPKDYAYGSHRGEFINRVSSFWLVREGGNWEALRIDLRWTIDPKNHAVEQAALVAALDMNDVNYMGAVKSAFHNSQAENPNSRGNFDACASENQGAVYELGRSLVYELRALGEL